MKLPKDPFPRDQAPSPDIKLLTVFDVNVVGLVTQHLDSQYDKILVIPNILDTVLKAQFPNGSVSINI